MRPGLAGAALALTVAVGCGGPDPTPTPTETRVPRDERTPAVEASPSAHPSSRLACVKFRQFGNAVEISSLTYEQAVNRVQEIAETASRGDEPAVREHASALSWSVIGTDNDAVVAAATSLDEACGNIGE